MSEPLLQVSELNKWFPIKEGLVIERTVDHVRAVDGVSFDVAEGETLGLVGESGSGKSTTGYCILQLLQPTSGSIRFMGKELTTLGRAELAAHAARDADRLPGSLLVAQPAHDGGRHGRASRCRSTASAPGAPGSRGCASCSTWSASTRASSNRYPHEFSGGQRQRIGIARALALSPEADHLRRAGLGARRVDPGADPEPAQGPPAGVRAHLSLHRPRPRRGTRDERPHRGHEPRASSSSWGRPRRCTPARKEAYTQALLSAVPVPDPRAMKLRKEERRRLRHALASVRPSAVARRRGCSPRGCGGSERAAVESAPSGIVGVGAGGLDAAAAELRRRRAGRATRSTRPEAWWARRAGRSRRSRATTRQRTSGRTCRSCRCRRARPPLPRSTGRSTSSAARRPDGNTAATWAWDGAALAGPRAVAARASSTTRPWRSAVRSTCSAASPTAASGARSTATTRPATAGRS